MEIQIPLILFTTLLAWAGGIFAAQGVLAVRKEAAKSQMTSLIAAFVILVVGGVAVLFHLAQPLHIFNGFGNPTSGITQELIAVVLVGIWMVVYFVMIRQSEDGNVPAWCGIVAIVLALVLDVVMAHSYMMGARPVWNSVLQVVSIVGASCMAGPATVAFICSLKGEATKTGDLMTFAGAIVGAVTTVAYLLFMSVSGSSFVNLGNYFDPTHPNATMLDSSQVSVFAGSALAPTVICIIAVVIAVVAAVLGMKKGEWKVMGCVGAVAAVVAAFALRVTFYCLGYATLMFY